MPAAVLKTPRPDTDWLSFLPVELLDLTEDARPASLGRPRHVDAAVLFADVSGFTAMSEALGHTGPQGTEELSRIINDVLAPMVGLVHRYGGVVAKFAGDALAALFVAEPGRAGEAARGALRCACEIQAAGERQAVRSTRAGDFAVAVSLGLAYGSVTTTVVGDPAVRLEHIVAGDPLNLCATAEYHAGRAGVVAERRLLELAGEGNHQGELLHAQDGASFLRVMPPGPDASARHTARPPPHGDARRAVAPFLHRSLVARLAAGQAQLISEHRTVTTLFCRFEDLDYERAAATREFQRTMAAVVATVARFDGYLRQVEMGDKGSKLIVLFGAPLAHEDDERRAVECALALRRLPGLASAAIGVNTGLVFCGLVGAPDRREYAALGDAVNAAARLMQMARPGQVLVSGATRERAGDRWSWAAVGAPAVGGTGQVTVFEPGPEPEPASVTGGVLRPRGGMVGRERELRVATTLLEHAAAGTGRALAVTGPAGIGKSRLLDDLIVVARARGFELHRGAALPYAGDKLYGGVRGVWRSLLHLQDANAARPSSLAQRLEAFAPGLGDRAPLLAPLLGLPIEDTEVTASLPPAARAEALQELAVTCLREQQRSVPLLIAVEDGHWLDPLSSTLLEYIAGEVRGWRALLVITERTGERGAGRLEALPGVTTLPLGDLGPTAIEELVRGTLAQLGGPTADAERALGRAVAARAGGNPFYAEELARFVHHRARSPEGDGRRTPGELPETLRAVITSRIDALGDRERAVLKVASVIGRRFSAEWLRGSYPQLGSAAEVDRSLATLSWLELAPLDLSEDEPAHVFKHALTRDVAYETLAFSAREALHESVARFVERSQPHERGDVLELLAYHYGRSANSEKQRLYLRRAGDAARHAYANDAAVDHYRRLLPLLDDGERGDVLIDLGEVLQLTGSREAYARYREALQVSEEAGKAASSARARAALGDLLAYTEDYPQGVAWLEGARADFLELGLPRAASRVYERLAFAYFEQGDYPRTVQRCEEHRRLAREIGDVAGESTAIETLGLVQWRQGALVQARRDLEEALALATRGGHKLGVVHALTDLAGLLKDLGEPAAAVERLQQAFELARDIGYRRQSAVIVANAGELFRARGDGELALRCWRLALPSLSTLNDVPTVLHSAINLAMLLRDEGAAAQAERLLGLAVDVSRAADNRPCLCEALLELGGARSELGQTAPALRTLAEALQLARRMSHQEIALTARLLIAELSAGGSLEDRRRKAREVELVLDEVLDDAGRAAVLSTLWRLDPRREDARCTAADLYRGIGARTESARARRSYAELTGEQLPEPGPLTLLVEHLPSASASPGDLLEPVVAALRHIRPSGARETGPLALTAT